MHVVTVEQSSDSVSAQAEEGSRAPWKCLLSSEFLLLRSHDSKRSIFGIEVKTQCGSKVFYPLLSLLKARLQTSDVSCEHLTEVLHRGPGQHPVFATCAQVLTSSIESTTRSPNPIHTPTQRPLIEGPQHVIGPLTRFH